jgi:hypothetical protein
MSLWSRLFRPTAALARAPAPESPRYQSPVWFGSFGNVPHDLILTTEQQMAVSVAWACIRAIVDPIAASEIKIWEERDKKRIEDTDSWLYWLLNVAPHPQYTAQGWGEVMLTRAVATGNSYSYIRRDGALRPFSLQPLESERMSMDEEGGSLVYVYRDPVNGQVTIPRRSRSRRRRRTTPPRTTRTVLTPGFSSSRPRR